MNMIIVNVVLSILIIVMAITVTVAIHKMNYSKAKNSALIKLNEILCINFGDIRISNAFAYAMTKIALGINDTYAAQIYLNTFKYIRDNLANETPTNSDEITNQEQDPSEEDIAKAQNAFLLNALIAASYNCKDVETGKKLIRYFAPIEEKSPSYVNKVISIRLEMDKKLQEVFDSVWSNHQHSQTDESTQAPQE